MSTLFVVGVIERGELQELLDSSVGFFDRKVVVSDLGELFVRLYEDRLSACALEASDYRWNYEEGVSVVVHSGGAVGSAELEEWFSGFMPVFNLVAVQESVDLVQFRELLHRLPEQNANCRDRIRRMAHWMYYGGSESCSCRVYSIVKQLQQVQRTSDVVRTVPAAIAKIDFGALLAVGSPADEAKYWRLLSTWSFQPHGLTARELLYCAFILLRKLSADAGITLPDGKLLLLLFTLEASYHQVNKFHNFKHAVDVMQATWQLCGNMIQDPLQVLLLSMAAIGHDIGHPGSNNMLLTKFESPVALLYKKESVLENMHKDFFQELLRSQWPQLLGLSQNYWRKDAKYNLIADTILATDMALHAEYVDKLKENHRIDNLKTLTSLIIKAADISNVTRPLAISAQWACLITLEFRDCSSLEEYEKHLLEGGDDQSAPQQLDDDVFKSMNNVRLLSPDDLVDKYPCIPGGQIFFIDTFAEQFFQEFCQKFPHLDFLIDNIQSNKKFWLGKL